MVVMQHCHPKGCYCQVGSVFKTALFLTLIVGVSTALAVWVYQNKFSPQDDRGASELELNDGRGARELDLIQLLRSNRPKVYIDGDGTLRRLVSDSRLGEGGEFGPAHLSPAGERTRLPLPVEAIEELTTKKPRTILEEILQHLDSDEEIDVDQSEELAGPERYFGLGKSVLLMRGQVNFVFINWYRLFTRKPLQGSCI